MSVLFCFVLFFFKNNLCHDLKIILENHEQITTRCHSCSKHIQTLPWLSEFGMGGEGRGRKGERKWRREFDPLYLCQLFWSQSILRRPLLFKSHWFHILISPIKFHKLKPCASNKRKRTVLSRVPNALWR